MYAKVLLSNTRNKQRILHSTHLLTYGGISSLFCFERRSTLHNLDNCKTIH